MTKVEYAPVPSRFDELLRRVYRDGETVLVTRAGRVVARMEPVDPAEVEADRRHRRLLRKVSRIR
jgi:antitoxin (DNA-binding transcriptional repressor) of toxin-antitoxin stability system